MEIKEGLESNLNVFEYAKPELASEQMAIIRLKLLKKEYAI